MTEQEAIKALKTCTTEACENCPMDGYANCITSLEEAALELIERQRSEIEKSTTEVDSLKKQMEWLTGYNQNLMSANTALSEEILIAKIEAYKEFAERLKSYLLLDKKGKISVITFEDVDKLLKELVGENNDENLL